MGETNELAKERNRAAAERTLTAWIKSSIALIGFGIAFEEIFVAVESSFSYVTDILKIKLVNFISLNFIAIGIFLLLLAVIQYILEVKNIESDRYIALSSRPLNIATSFAVVLFGFLCLIASFIKLKT